MDRRFSLLLLGLLLQVLPAHAAAPNNDAEDQAWAIAAEADVAPGYKAYLTEYPKGRYAPTARIKLAILNGGPALANGQPAARNAPVKIEARRSVPRPQLPFELSEELWQTIEQSDLYKSSPRRRVVELSYTEVADVDLGRMQVKTTTSNVKRFSPVAEAFPALLELDTSFDMRSVASSGGTPTRTQGGAREFTVGGFLPLASIDREGRLQGQLLRINELKGSLFPLKSGAELSLRYEFAFLSDRKFDSVVDLNCRVGDKTGAALLNPQLSGNAWQLKCQDIRQMNGKTTQGNYETYVLEDIGLSGTMIGILDFSKSRIVLPSGSSYSYVHTVAGGGTTHRNIDNYRISSRD